MGDLICHDSGRSPHQWFREMAERYGTSLKGVTCSGIFEAADGSREIHTFWVGGMSRQEALYMVTKLKREIERELFNDGYSEVVSG